MSDNVQRNVFQTFPTCIYIIKPLSTSSCIHFSHRKSQLENKPEKNLSANYIHINHFDTQNLNMVHFENGIDPIPSLKFDSDM